MAKNIGRELKIFTVYLLVFANLSSFIDVLADIHRAMCTCADVFHAMVHSSFGTFWTVAVRYGDVDMLLYSAGRPLV